MYKKNVSLWVKSIRYANVFLSTRYVNMVSKYSWLLKLEIQIYFVK